MAAFAHRWRKASGLGLLISVVAAMVVAVLGYGTAAFVILSVGGLVGIPIQLVAATKARPGLVWEGSHAEPWRAERSAGDWAAIESRRRD